MKIIVILLALAALTGCENWSWDRARQSMLNAPPGLWNWGGQAQQPMLCTYNGMTVYCN